MGVICVFDIKRKKIPVYMLIILAAAGIISNFTVGEFDIEKRIIAMLPGMILLIVSMITKQQIGYGDGMIILIMGLYIDIDDILSIVLSSFLLSSIAALILMTVFKKKKNVQKSAGTESVFGLFRFFPGLFPAGFTVFFFIRH